MPAYGIVVFLHIVGALGLFAGIGLEQVSLARLRDVRTTNQARDWLGVLSSLRRVDGPSGLLILVTGFFMMATRWQGQAWIGLAIAGMVVMAALSIAVTSRRVRALKDALPSVDGPISTALIARLSDPAMRASATIRAAIALGIVFNMAVKPTPLSAFAAMIVALAVGILLAFTLSYGRRRIRVGEPLGSA